MEKEKNTNRLDKILIAEDSPVQAEKLKHLLEENGFQVMAAGNGRQALAVLNDGYRPFLIISDILMPEMDGYELSKRIKGDKKLNNIPVILLTSLSDMKDIIKGLECGANSFIVKPYDDKNLISRIQQIKTNLDLRKNWKSDSSLHVFFSGDTYRIAADKLQILDFLLPSYEEAYLKNAELIRVDNELKQLNEQLEKKVEDRTASLTKEISERKRAEEKIRALNDDLERRVNERTAELKKTISQLEELNKVFVGRELRMAQLKERITELEKQQGISSDA